MSESLTRTELAEYGDKYYKFSFIGWGLQRISGLIIILWSILHVYSAYLLTLGPEAYESELAFYHSIPFYILLYYILGAVIGFHGLMGLIIILNDVRVRSGNRGENRLYGISYWFSTRYKLGVTKYSWSLRRISGIVLLFLVLYHVVRIHLILGEEYYLNWYKVVKFGYGSLESLLLYLIFVFVLSFHGSDGLRVILIDFLGIESGKKLTALTTLLGFLFFIFAAWIAITLYYFSNNILIPITR